jgi:hypothetical protein
MIVRDLVNQLLKTGSPKKDAVETLLESFSNMDDIVIAVFDDMKFNFVITPSIRSGSLKLRFGSDDLPPTAFANICKRGKYFYLFNKVLPDSLYGYRLTKIKNFVYGFDLPHWYSDGDYNKGRSFE